jgi:hypothetical protein
MAAACCRRPPSHPAACAASRVRSFVLLVLRAAATPCGARRGRCGEARHEIVRGTAGDGFGGQARRHHLAGRLLLNAHVAAGLAEWGHVRAPAAASKPHWWSRSPLRNRKGVLQERLAAPAWCVRARTRWQSAPRLRLERAACSDALEFKPEPWTKITD